MASQAKNEKKKVLRIGVIQGGKLVQERLVPSGETVTIGESAKATFVFPKTGLPRAEYPLFVYRKGHYVLNFTEDMKGKISSAGAAVTLAKLRSDPAVANQGGSWRLALTDQDRGKIEIGDVKSLFQFVPPPPVQAASCWGVSSEVEHSAFNRLVLGSIPRRPTISSWFALWANR